MGRESFLDTLSCETSLEIPSERSLFSLSGIRRTKIEKIVNEFGEGIIRVDGEIPVDLSIENKDRFLFISYDQSAFTHGLHKYPAKFFPELPRWLVKKYSSESNWVLDPFAGSGTVNVECLLARRHSVAVDVDPFSRFLTQVKVTPLNVNALKRSYAWLRERIKSYDPSKLSDQDFPDFPYRDNWFNKDILEELAYLKKAILDLKKVLSNLNNDETNEITNFFLICFSSIIRAVSNADDNCTRTVIRKKLNKRVSKGDALRKFLKVVDTNAPKMIAFSESCPSDITVDITTDSDARDIKFADESFHLAVTSPPYVNAVDYPRTHQLEIYWLGIENGSLVHLKKQHVGTEVVNHSEYKHLRKIGVKDADDVLAEIYRKDSRRSYIVYKYLTDMQKNLLEVKRVLKPGGRYVIVVGNNRIRGCLVETWKYLMEMAERSGFKIDCYFASEIIRHFIKVPREERIQTDWVLVFRK